MGIQFLSPLFLAGLFTAAIPVVIHMINRRRAKVLPIGTLRFLRQIPARTIRRKRIEEYILLALRCALLALLALGAARPVITETGAGGGATSMVVVLDNSFSMDHRVSGITRFQAGVEATIRVIRSLSEGDRAALMLASDPAADNLTTSPAEIRGLATILTTDLAGIRRRAGTARISLTASDVLAAVEKGFTLLREAPEPNRELVLVTDLQNRAVRPLVERLLKKDGDMGIRVVVVDVGALSPQNLTLGAVQAGAGVAIAGEPMRVTATVRNSGPERVTTRISLVLGEERVAEEQVSLEAGESKAVPFTVISDLPGVGGGRVLLPGDHLLTDDIRYFALPVVSRIPVLAVNGDPAPLAWQDETFYLRAALAPEDMGGTKIRSPVNLKVITTRDLPDENLSLFKVVVLANVGALSSPVVTRLRAFVRSGGGLVIFGGNQVRAGEMNHLLGTEPATGLLPAVLTAPTQLGTSPEEMISLAEAEEAHPLFADLPAKALQDLRKVHARRLLGADPQGCGGRVLARLENGAPFLLEKTVGRGRVLLFTTSADAAWGNLPIRPIFLPLLHRTMQYLAGGGAEGTDFLLGEEVEIPAPPPRAPPPEVTDPRGDLRRVTGDLVYGPLQLPGLYRVNGSGNGEPFLFSANPDPAEGDLVRANPEILRDLFGADRFRLYRELDTLEAGLTRSREGRPIWGWLILTALLVLLFEAFFANRIAAARADRDRNAATDEDQTGREE